MRDAYETRDIQRNGRTYRVEFVADCDMGEPWKEHDGHGIVSDWTSRDKMPGEVVINEDRGSKRFYDVAATMKLARRDGWGLSPYDFAALRNKLNRIPTKREVTAETVRLDCERMRDWCNDVWHWCGVVVFPLTEDGDELRSKSQSLWGIESDAAEYFDEVIADLIAEIEG